MKHFQFFMVNIQLMKSEKNKLVSNKIGKFSRLGKLVEKTLYNTEKMEKSKKIFQTGKIGESLENKFMY